MSAPDDPPRFEQVDWDEVDRTPTVVTPQRAALFVGFLVVAAIYWYDATFTNLYLVGEWRVERIDWVFMIALVVLVAYVAVPAVRGRDRLRRQLSGFRSRPGALLGVAYLAVVAVVGLLEPVVYSDIVLQFENVYQPPVGFTAETGWQRCAGEVTGDVFEQVCHGSMEYPLGTNHRGFPMGYLLATGARVATYVLVITAAFVVPLAATVGLVAGLRGGLVDDLLMGYVDLQLSVPALIVYFVGYAYLNPSLLLLIATFGLFSWGGIARLVRSEVLQRREAGHVRVARSFGAPWRYVARRHVLPNVTNTLVPAVFQLLALLVLVEAGVAFLGFHELRLYSWGATITESVDSVVSGQIEILTEKPSAKKIWWVSTLPAVALTLTMLSLKLVGDGLRDALDPRGEH